MQDIPAAFERALGEIRARVSASGAKLGRSNGSNGGNPDQGFAIAVAYSGGLDSSVLLWLAAAYARQHQVRIEALHVHHGLSANADDWSAHCERVCLALGVELHVSTVSVSGAGTGIEAAARSARYAALGQACHARHLPVLLTAHHQDDQAETVLLQLLRGAGVAGLSGMGDGEQRPALLGADILLARPLLGMRRTELEAFAAQHDLQSVTDESNSDQRYRRNALRHEVLPALEQLVPACTGLIARSARHMQSAQVLLDELAGIDLANCAGEGGTALRIAALQQLSPTRADNLLRYWLGQQGLRMPTSGQLEQVRRQMLLGAPDQQPVVRIGPFELRRSAGLLQIHVLSEAAQDWQGETGGVSWQGEDLIEVPSWHGRLLFQRSAGPAVPEAVLRATTLVLRPRQGQERLKLASNRPSRTLKNLFQEAGIPGGSRLHLPLVFFGDELLLAAGLGLNLNCSALTPEPGITLGWLPD